MKIPTSSQRIPLSNLVIDTDPLRRNVRDDNWQDPKALGQLTDLIRLQGQLEDGAVEEIDGKYFVRRGEGRFRALSALSEQGAIDPQTTKVFDTFKAKVYKGLTDRERFELIVDHTHRKLTRPDLQLAFEKAFDSGYTEKDTIVALTPIIDDVSPPTREVKNDADLLAMRKGVLDVAKAAWRGPTVLRNAYMDKLRGKQAWPTNGEVKDLSRIFAKEMESDKTGKTNKDNPGPGFMEKWNQKLKKVDEAKEEGKNKPKSVSQANRDQIKGYIGQCKSQAMKIAFMLVLNDTYSPVDLPILDKAVSLAFEGKATEAQNVIEELVNSRLASTPAAAAA